MLWSCAVGLPSIVHKQSSPRVFAAVLPWTLESWAEYDIRGFGQEDLVSRYANKEHALVLLNHRGDLDWMIGWVMIDRLGMLGVSGEP